MSRLISIIINLIKNIKKISSRKRRLLLLILDSFILLFSIYISFWIRLGEPFSDQLIENIWLFPFSLFFGIPIYIFTGQYKGLTKYQEGKYFNQICYRNGLLVLFLSLFGIMLSLPSPPRTCLILIFFITSLLSNSIKINLSELLIKIKSKKRKKVVIYGAGEAGAQLAASLKISGEYKIICFIDDSPYLWKRKLYNIPIKKPEILKKLSFKIDKIFFAISSISKNQKSYILNNLGNYKIPVFEIPSMEDLTSGKAKIDFLKPIEIENLLGRERIYAKSDLLKASIHDKCICVTGAGGSIGSELCRQIIFLKPSKLILIDISEENLFYIERELLKNRVKSIQIKSILGDTCNSKLMLKIFKTEAVNIVFHAAAYKHVPIVENNPLVGIYNNVFSTKSLCEAVILSDVSKFILISTDKAVRPKNVMGASKRLAELVVQAYSNDYIYKNDNKLKTFSMVRFGNVLNSSGSVVPIFKEQIASGGPITITHPNIIRYFMTIEEAANLVIQSAELAEGGEVFLLDMGEPIKIIDLAEQMIKQSGLTLKNENNKDGDIEIIFTGLRSGEKLFEELLIDAKCVKTIHPLIYKAFEKSKEKKELLTYLTILEEGIEEFNLNKTLKQLNKIIPEWEYSDNPN